MHDARRRTSLFTCSALIVATLIISATSVVAQDRIVVIRRSETIIADGTPENLGAVQKRIATAVFQGFSGLEAAGVERERSAIMN